MQNITAEIIGGESVAQCGKLFDELMAYQKSKASAHPEWFDSMSFDTRMKKSLENALESQVIIVKDNGSPAGYVFSTIDNVCAADKNARPEWVRSNADCMGFYPDWVELPQKIGCLNNLYLRDEYRGAGLGARLFDMAMEWLEGFPDVNLYFVYISNGNDGALKFYLNRGFAFSHDAFGGFIKAAFKRKNKNQRGV